MRFTRSRLAALAATSMLAAPFGASLGAQAGPALPSVLSYRTEKVADGIYAFITPEERTGFQSGNSIAIIGDDGVLVVDTGNIPSSTRRQIAEIRKLTTKPVRYVVNTHWHPDHNLGNAEYRAAFPGVTIIGTTATRTGITERIPGYLAQLRGFATTDSLMKVRLATGKARDGSPLPDAVKVMWQLNVTDYDQFMPEVATAVASPPDLLVDDSLTVMLGARAVKVVSDGRGNTAGDLYVYVPNANVVATGDLVTFPCPFPTTSYFSGWIRALNAIEALHADVLIPGHGEVQHDAAYLGAVRALLTFTLDQARAAVRAGLSLEDTKKKVDFGEYARRFGRGELIATDAFNSFYASGALDRAYAEAKYESQGPLP